MSVSFNSVSGAIGYEVLSWVAHLDEGRRSRGVLQWGRVDPLHGRSRLSPSQPVRGAAACGGTCLRSKRGNAYLGITPGVEYTFSPRRITIFSGGEKFKKRRCLVDQIR